MFKGILQGWYLEVSHWNNTKSIPGRLGCQADTLHSADLEASLKAAEEFLPSVAHDALTC